MINTVSMYIMDSIKHIMKHRGCCGYTPCHGCHLANHPDPRICGPGYSQRSRRFALSLLILLKVAEAYYE